MNLPVDFNRSFERRGTRSIKWDSYPRDVLPLSIADLDFPSPPAVVEALTARAASGWYGYARPDPEAGRAVASWFGGQFGHEVDPEWIVWLPGVVPALTAVCSLVDGEILTTTPNYSRLLSAPLVAGRPRLLSPLRKTGTRYEMDFDDLEARVTPQTKLFLLTNPHNPVGRVYSRQELDRLVGFCEAHDLVLVSDEIHCELVFDGPHVPVLTLGPGAQARSITFLSPAKTCNLPGIPAALALVPDPTLRKAFERVAAPLGRPGCLGLEAIRSAYSDAAEWKLALVDHLRANRDYLVNELARRFPGLEIAPVEGTSLVWLDFRPLGVAEPYRYFLDHARVAFTDGKDFGGEGFVRLNFGCRRSLLTEALDRLETAWKALDTGA